VKLKRIFIGILLFILIGEVMMRFDEKFELLQENRVVKALTEIALTAEYTMLKANTFAVDSNDLRVMVLGDSYISGAGLDPKDNFCQQLKELLKANNRRFRNIFVFDASIPKNNNLDNNETYFTYVDKFKPDIIVLGYNYNDLMENLQKKNASDTIDKSTEKARSSIEKKSTVRRMVDFAFKSKFARYLHANLYTQLKARGIIFPNSEFDVMMRSYSENSERWNTSKILLKEWLDDAQKRNIETIVLQCPQTDLMKYRKLFVHADSAIKHFFESSPGVEYRSVVDFLKGEDLSKYVLSKYDGHSNAKAHKKIAEAVYALIRANSVWGESFKKIQQK